MLPDRVLNPGPLTYEAGALPIALRGPAWFTFTHASTHSKYAIKSRSKLMYRLMQICANAAIFTKCLKKHKLQ